jgi:hypothetical protein
MHSQRFRLLSSTSLFAAGFLLATSSFGLFAADDADVAEAQADTVAMVSVGAQFIDVEPLVGFDQAVLRVAGPDGYALTTVVSAQEGNYITADLLLDAEDARRNGMEELQPWMNLPNGNYYYEIILQTNDGHSERQSGVFEVRDGAALKNEPEPLSDSTEGGLFGRMAGALLDLLIPSASAQAGDFDDFVSIRNVSGTGESRLNLNATDSISVTADAWRVRNNATANHRFEVVEGVGTNRMVVLQGGAVGIGTVAPQDRLHVESGSGFQIRLTSGAHTTRLDGFGSYFRISQNSLNQFRVHQDAPSQSLSVESDGTLTTAGGATFGGVANVNSNLVNINSSGSTSFVNNITSTRDFMAGIGSSGDWGVCDNSLPCFFGLRIRPGVPNNTLVLNSDGFVGVGTNSPEDPLHVRRSSGDAAAVRVESAHGTTANRRLFFLRNNGNPIFRFEDTSDAEKVWDFRLTANGFAITRLGTGTLEMDLRNNGNVFFAGTVQGGSSREIKHGIADIEPLELLSRLEQLPVKEWRYDAAPEERRIGPMAEDFFSLFELGSSPEHIAPSDMAGVAMAAAQALAGQSRELQRENEELRLRLERLEKSLLQ